MTLWHALACGAAWLLVACASGEAWRPGVSDRTHTPTVRPVTPSQASADPWTPMASVSAFPTVDDRKLPSSGHNPPFWAGVVRVNEALKGPYGQLSPTTIAPVGAIAVEAHYDLSGSTQQLFAMEKRAPGFDPPGGDWEYIVLDPSGNVSSRGILSFCARCHAEAPHDHLFGPRLSTRRHVLQAAENREPPPETDDDEGAAPDENTPPGTGEPRVDRPKKKRRK